MCEAVIFLVAFDEKLILQHQIGIVFGGI